MAVRLLAYEVADLCLGKPPLKSLSVVSSTVGDALAALRSSDDNYISVWSCDHSSEVKDSCKCIGKVCMVDVIIYLCRQENLSSPSSAIKSPVSLLISNVPALVRHVDPSSRYIYIYIPSHLFVSLHAFIIVNFSLHCFVCFFVSLTCWC